MQIGTHNGAFHADDVLGVAVLLALYKDAQVVRTRDPVRLAACDILVDVGGLYDPATNRFDHHQAGFAEARGNGVPYAGAGLTWKAYGAAYVATCCPGLSAEVCQQVADLVDAALICHADAVDSGVTVAGPVEFGLAGLVSNFNATWLDDDTLSSDLRFMQAVGVVQVLLQNLVRNTAATLEASVLVRQAPRIEEGRVLVLGRPRVPFSNIICAELPEVLFVVYPDSEGDSYQVRVVPVEPDSFVARQNLPAAWAGLRDEELAQVTGVPDAIFAHNGRFICGARSKEGALQLARLALKG